MTLKSITDQLDIWYQWRESYNKFVPRFINEAKNKMDWREWDPDIFHEFFEQARDQCVSSLQQGYFSNEEKEKIKENWSEIGPLLKQISIVQDHLQLDVYNDLAKVIRKYTSQNRVASTNRLIASLQPDMLCTVINTSKLNELIYLLNENIESCHIGNNGLWYEKSKAVLDFFVSELNQPASEIMTLPWQVYEFLKLGHNNNSNDMSENKSIEEELIQLLQFKKQIILQGPPGTGKTKMAKDLAQLITETVFSKEVIIASLSVGDKIDNASGAKDYYTIKELGESSLTLESDRTTQDWKPSYKEIINKYNSLVSGEQVENSNGLNPYELAVAKHFFNLYGRSIDSEQVKIIQFHPSYSYEDFVRGMSVKSTPDKKGVVYETENRIFGSIIEEANRNLIDSQKDTDTLSYENWVMTNFESFIEYLSSQLPDPTSTIRLTDKVNIVSVEEESLRYKGRKGWSRLGNRMLFEDVIKAIVDNNQSRQDIKNNTNLSGLAKWHASYYIRVVDLFHSFVDEKKLEYKPTEETLVPRKEYVLIIDEINRANLSSVLGELIYSLEYRNQGINSIYSTTDSDELLIPENLYIIGTMNTADRSVSQIDYAIRRRFAFVDVLPEELQSNDEIIFHSKLFKKVSELFIENADEFLSDPKNVKIMPTKHLINDFQPKDVWIGHSYFIQKKDNGILIPEDMQIRLDYEIKPILREYVKDGILKQTAKDEIEKLTC